MRHGGAYTHPTRLNAHYDICLICEKMMVTLVPGWSPLYLVILAPPAVAGTSVARYKSSGHAGTWSLPYLLHRHLDPSWQLLANA